VKNLRGRGILEEERGGGKRGKPRKKKTASRLQEGREIGKRRGGGSFPTKASHVTKGNRKKRTFNVLLLMDS